MTAIILHSGAPASLISGCEVTVAGFDMLAVEANVYIQLKRQQVHFTPASVVFKMAVDEKGIEQITATWAYGAVTNTFPRLIYDKTKEGL